MNLTIVTEFLCFNSFLCPTIANSSFLIHGFICFVLFLAYSRNLKLFFIFIMYTKATK